ncbi:DUF4145 domain-containing protein [Thalassolituus oleivorans]|uniref:DUF4145 domain-containing protein n=1 Tax=Thalassolituus oleivorans TaxID=187493 RepID=UPI00240989FB|nr:DUF4145 domain-containing protein [Thalassolituus oleivorans]MDF1641465.1 DUF4145 domain-containing protein [Thalassolituus oleivorans]
MARKEHWTCPYCNRDCTLGDEDIKFCEDKAYLAEDHGYAKANFKILICPSPECRKISIKAHYFTSANYDGRYKKVYEWQLIPEANAKPFPDYIPQQLRDDYFEACLIKEKSAKASATLSRRCLQGIIRDFWGIKEKNLFNEIAALEDKVDATTWEAIDSVRKVGNIGAHMEKDVNIIIDVEPEEAELLIWLIETLFEEWYIERHTREEKMKKISQIAKQKAEAKAAAKDSDS